jgi:hypothetical protein
MDKLLTFVKDMNEVLHEKDPIFEEMPLEYSTTGYESLIGINGTRLWISNEHSNWTDLLEETYRLAEAYSLLHKTLREFFRGKLNKDIEKMYGLGVEDEEELGMEQPTTPLSERNHPEV